MRRNNELPNSALIGARMSKWAVTEWLLNSLDTIDAAEQRVYPQRYESSIRH